MGDEVAVMGGGQVAQQGGPTDLYELPATREVAEFIGDANFVAGRSRPATGPRRPSGAVPAPRRGLGAGRGDGPPGAARAPGPAATATVERIEYYGHDAVYLVALDAGGAVRSRVIGAPELAPGRRAWRWTFTGAPDRGLRRAAAARRAPCPRPGLTRGDRRPAGAGGGPGRGGRGLPRGPRGPPGDPGRAGRPRRRRRGQPRGRRRARRPRQPPPAPVDRAAHPGRAARAAGRRPAACARATGASAWAAAGSPSPCGPLDLAAAPAARHGRRRAARRGPRARRAGPRADTFAEVLRAALGPTLCERFYFPYARKIWGLDPAELSGEQARRRVGARSPGRMVAPRPRARERRASGSSSTRAAATGRSGRRSPTPPPRAGAEVLLGAEARGVELRPDGARVDAGRRAGGRGARGSGRRCPSPRSRGWPSPGAAGRRRSPPRRRSSTGRWRWSTSCCRGRRYTPFDAHYLPGGATPVTRVSEPRNYRDGDDPAGAHRAVRRDPVRRPSGGALRARRRRARARWRPTASPRPGLPRPEVAARRGGAPAPRLPGAAGRRRAPISPRSTRWAAAQPALLTLGRQALFVHDNAHHALAMAWAAADCLGRDGAFDDAGLGRAPGAASRPTSSRTDAALSSRQDRGDDAAQVRPEAHERAPVLAEAVA